MKQIDYHTAENAEVAHVVVFTVGDDGLQDEVLAEFYPLKGDDGISGAEVRARYFVTWERLRWTPPITCEKPKGMPMTLLDGKPEGFHPPYTDRYFRTDPEIDKRDT